MSGVALRCPASGETLHREGAELVSASGKHRYELHGGRIALLDAHLSEDARRQQRHYDRIAPAYLESLAEPQAEEYGAALDALFLELAGAAPLGRVAEICCGQGDALALLSGHLDAAVGVDVSLAMLEVAAARLGEDRFTLAQADALRLPLEDGSVDTVVMFGGIHHVSDRRGLFREVTRVLRPGGRFLFREPVSDFAPWRALRALIYRLSPELDHETERPLRFEETEPPLAAAGLRLTAWRTCGLLGFGLLMNSDVLIVNRWLRFVPGIRRVARALFALDQWLLGRPGFSRAGLQVVGEAVKAAE